MRKHHLYESIELGVQELATEIHSLLTIAWVRSRLRRGEHCKMCVARPDSPSGFLQPAEHTYC